MNSKTELIEPSHIGDGLYFTDNGWYVSIAVNHHNNEVAVLDIDNVDKAIEYLNKVKNRIKNTKI